MVASLPYSGPCSCSEPPMLAVQHHQPLHHYHQMLHEDAVVAPPSLKVSPSRKAASKLSSPVVVSKEELPAAPSSPSSPPRSRSTTRRVSFATNDQGKIKLNVFRYVCSAEQRSAMYSDPSDGDRILDGCRRLVMIYRNRSDYMDSLDMLYTDPLLLHHDAAAEESALRLVSRCSSRGLERQIYKNIKAGRRATIARMLELQASQVDDLEQKMATLSIQSSARDKFFALKMGLGDDKEAKRVYTESSYSSSLSSSALRPANNNNNNNNSNHSNMWLDGRSDHSMSSMSSMSSISSMGSSNSLRFLRSAH